MIKRIAFIAIVVGVGFAYDKYSESEAFETQSRALITKIGGNVIDSLGKDQECSGALKIDSIAFDRDGLFSKKGEGKLFISGAGDSVFSIQYTAEESGEKVYVSPKDTAAAQSAVFNFAMRGCK